VVLIESRPIKLTTRTGVMVQRTIPHAKLRMVGPWCFADHFGPTKQTDGMVVAAHPHTGLQTVTWLFEGEVEHRDSIGSVQLIKPGQLNLMTAGRGISHSELSLAGPANLHAVQLWVALPKEAIDVAPEFEHQAELPWIENQNAQFTVLAGSYLGLESPTKTFSQMVGVEIRIPANTNVTLPLNPEFEHGVLMVQGSSTVAGIDQAISSLQYFEVGQTDVEIVAEQESILILLGGKPFGEKILMWWNFIGRNHQDIALAREQWNGREERFGSFEDRIGGWIPAPELPHVELRAR
jgi:quercetin 2,3-dioxygenase